MKENEEVTKGDVQNEIDLNKEDKKDDSINENKKNEDEKVSNLPPMGPRMTLFQALQEKQNKHVLNMLIFMTILLVVVGFGSFYLGKFWFPIIFKSMDPQNAGAYGCILAVFTTQACIIWFYFYSKKVDQFYEQEENRLIQERKLQNQKTIKTE